MVSKSGFNVGWNVVVVGVVIKQPTLETRWSVGGVNCIKLMFSFHWMSSVWRHLLHGLWQTCVIHGLNAVCLTGSV